MYKILKTNQLHQITVILLSNFDKSNNKTNFVKVKDKRKNQTICSILINQIDVSMNFSMDM